MRDRHCSARNRNIHHAISMVFILCTTIAVTRADSYASAQQERTVSEGELKELVVSVCERLKRVFAFPEKTPVICDGLYRHLKEGKYARHTDPAKLADRIGKDLKELSGDKHLGIVYDPKAAADMKAHDDSGDADAYLTPQMIEEERQSNFGFKRIEVLPGNIGYMDLRIFFAPKYAGETAAAAMRFLSHCDALIIDLRNNGGGWDEMVTFLMTYFFDGDEAVDFSVSYSPYRDSYYQSRTAPYVPGRIFPEAPLYVLTSKSTFSGAEAFAHYMKHLGRATIIGERTRGGQSPVEIQTIGEGYVIYIPESKLVKDVTGKMWEGVGVKADIEVDARQALHIGHMEALRTLSKMATDEDDRSRYAWIMDGLDARNSPAPVAQDILQSYAGTYGSRTIHYENGGLLYQYGDRSKMRMIPISENLFLVDVYDNIRVRFIRERSRVVGFEQLRSNGRTTKYSRE